MQWSLAATSKANTRRGEESKKKVLLPRSSEQARCPRVSFPASSKLKCRGFGHWDKGLAGVHPPQSEHRVLLSASRHESHHRKRGHQPPYPNWPLGIAAASGASHLWLGNQRDSSAKQIQRSEVTNFLLALFFLSFFLFGKALEIFLKGLSQQLPSCFITLSTATSSN